MEPSQEVQGAVVAVDQKVHRGYAAVGTALDLEENLDPEETSQGARHKAN